MTRNQLTLQQNLETQRSNKVREVETNRHNVVTENEINRHNLETERLGWSNLEEQRRHSQETERLGLLNFSELQRSNLANEAIKRGNLGLGYANLGLGYAQLSELNRHQLETESNARQNTIYQGVQTANQAHHLSEQEEMWRQQLAETYRHDVAQENLQFGEIASKTITSALDILVGAATKNKARKVKVK